MGVQRESQCCIDRNQPEVEYGCWAWLCFIPLKNLFSCYDLSCSQTHLLRRGQWWNALKHRCFRFGTLRSWNWDKSFAYRMLIWYFPWYHHFWQGKAIRWNWEKGKKLISNARPLIAWPTPCIVVWLWWHFGVVPCLAEITKPFTLFHWSVTEC